MDLDYGDVYPANGIDDDYDMGDPDSTITSEQPCCYHITDSTPPNGKNVTNMTNFHRGQDVIHYYTSRNNWGGDHVEDRKDKTKFMLRHSTKDQIVCDGTYPGDTYVGSPSTSEEWVSDRYTYLIVSGHWYTTRVVFNTDKGYTSFDFFARDEGTDGNGTGANWTGYKNVTREPEDTGNCAWYTNPGSELKEVDAPFFIGDDIIHDAYGGKDSPGHDYTPWLMGKMDWLSLKPIAYYAGVEGGPWRGNTDPVADAGVDQIVAPGSFVTLDGSGSYDGDRDSLTYNWSITSKPTGSMAALNDNTIVNPSFTADVGGIYTIEVTVEDDFRGSATDTITVTASP